MSPSISRATSEAPRVIGIQRAATTDAALRQPSARLVLVTLFGASVCLMGLIVLLTLSDRLYNGLRWVLVGNVGFALVVNAGLLALAKRARFPERWAVPAAVLAMVITGDAIAMLANDVSWPTEIYLPGWSPVAVWALAISLLMAFPPKLAFFSTLAVTLTDPLTALWLDASGQITLPDTQHLIFRFAPNFAAPVLALMIASVLRRLQARLDAVKALGAYTLSERLGKGGMGEVWRASHRILKREVAVKLIAPDAHDPAGTDQRRHRFEREARATARLQSPHSIHVYDFGAEPDGTFYYVMELLDGIDLSTLTQRFGPQRAERVVQILAQAAHSLGEAHDQGLVHRDIKPANIFLCRYGGEVDFVKVLDFGLVKQLGLTGADRDPMLTDDHALRGTPAFMAPEQILGDPVDGRTDIYGLGCVAYQLLTGREPFIAPTPTKLLMAHMMETPAPPSSLSELPVPPALDALVLACLAKKPDDRPQTTDALCAALAEVPLDRPWTAARAREWWRMQLPERVQGPVDSPASSPRDAIPTAKRLRASR